MAKPVHVLGQTLKGQAHAVEYFRGPISDRLHGLKRTLPRRSRRIPNRPTGLGQRLPGRHMPCHLQVLSDYSLPPLLLRLGLVTYGLLFFAHCPRLVGAPQKSIPGTTGNRPRPTCVPVKGGNVRVRISAPCGAFANVIARWRNLNFRLLTSHRFRHLLVLRLPLDPLQPRIRFLRRGRRVARGRSQHGTGIANTRFLANLRLDGLESRVRFNESP